MRDRRSSRTVVGVGDAVSEVIAGSLCVVDVLGRIMRRQSIRRKCGFDFASSLTYIAEASQEALIVE
jgi:hypothetical protein